MFCDIVGSKIKDDIELICRSYDNGLTYNQIKEKYRYSTTTIGKIVKGRRTRSEAGKACYRNGRHVLTDEGRLKLSENGRKSCARSGKFWTKPERCFRELIIEMGIGVKYPDYIKEIKGVIDDKTEKMFCYQYPVQRYVLDFVDLENKIAINVNGDYWHANPLLYSEDKLGKMQKINVRQDKNKKIFLEKNGWKVIDIWESEIYWNKELVKDKIRAFSLSAKPIVYTDERGVQFPQCPPDWSETIKKLWFKTDKIIRQKKVMVDIVCPVCKKTFKTQDRGKKTHKYCCEECRCLKSRKVDRPSKEQLELDILNMSFVKIGKKYSVSDNAVRKWAKTYNLTF